MALMDTGNDFSMYPPLPEGQEYYWMGPGMLGIRDRAAEPIPIPNVTLVLVKQLAERFARLEAKLDAFMKAFE
jgi:hypothetical protein